MHRSQGPVRPRLPVCLLALLAFSTGAADTPLHLEKDESWDASLATLAQTGVPRTWLVLGPLSNKFLRNFRSPEGLEPDRVEDWDKVPKDPSGKPFRMTQWTRPEGDAGASVSLAEILDTTLTEAIGYARTEVEWPVDGAALVYFGSSGPARVYVNGQRVLAEDGLAKADASTEGPYCLPVRMKAGRNSVRVAALGSRRAWDFSLRLERNDPPYRIQLQERLLELYPQEAAGWRGAEALLEIARRREELGEHPAALAAYRRALATFRASDEYRVQALSGLLAVLRQTHDWTALASEGARYLSTSGRAQGRHQALRACVLGNELGGKRDAAEACLARWLEHASGSDRAYALWVAAGAAQEAGDRDRAAAAERRAAANQPENERAVLAAQWTRAQTWPSADAAEQGGRAIERLVQILMQAGETGAADEMLRSYVCRFPRQQDYTGRFLVMRAAWRQDPEAGLPFAERVVRDLPGASEAVRRQAAALAARRARAGRRLLDVPNDVLVAADAARRQVANGTAEDVERALRNMAEVLRAHPLALVPAAPGRLIGVREFIRLLLTQSGPETRALYRKTVESAAASRFRGAAEQGEPLELEALAAEFPFSPVSAQALNLAGNLYLDRGSFPQAAAAFQLLLRDYRDVEVPSLPLVLAKLARAHLLAGDLPAAHAAAARLARESGTQPLTVAGKPLPAGEYAQALLDQVARAELAGGRTAAEATETYGGNPARTGAATSVAKSPPQGLAWSTPMFAPSALERLGGGLSPAAAGYLASYPVVSRDVVFVATLESLQALDALTGRVAWTRTWDEGAGRRAAWFYGLPVTCPTVLDGKVYLRMVSGDRSALRCYEAEDGHLRWSAESEPGPVRQVWLSDPAVAYGMAVAVFVMRGETTVYGVAALDVETGRPRWIRRFTQAGGLSREEKDALGPLELGPPAVEGGVVYTPTGQGALAALNIFSGEVLWLTAYPRVAADSPEGRSRAAGLLARGPLAPVATEDVVVMAPRDGTGLFAFGHAQGELRWKHDFCDERFLAGLCEGNIVALGRHVRAIRASSGETVWEYGLDGEKLVGQPGFSGGVLYLPLPSRLQLLDAVTGLPRGEYHWDPHIGALANLVVTPRRIIGVNERYLAALLPAGEARVAHPLDEAHALAAQGQYEAAARQYARALAADRNAWVSALCGRARALAHLGRQAEAWEEASRFLADKSAWLQAGGGDWQVSRQALTEALEDELGRQALRPDRPPEGLTGLVAPAWRLEGAEPELVFPEDGPQDRFLARVGSRLYAVRLSRRVDLLWETWVGAPLAGVAAGAKAVAVFSPTRLRVLDRGTGETLWQAFPPDGLSGRGFGAVALGPGLVLAAADETLLAFEAHTGKELWRDRIAGYVPRQLLLRGDQLVEVAGVVRDRQEGFKGLAFAVREAATGRPLKPFQSLKDGGEDRETAVSPDGRYLLFRPAADRLAAWDLLQGEKAWEVRVPSLKLAVRHGGLRFAHGRILYCGESQEHRGYATYEMDPARGEVLTVHTPSDLRVGEARVHIDSNGQSLVVTRLDKDKPFWRVTATDAPPLGDQEPLWMSLSADGELLYLLSVRRSGIPQFVLRTLDWDNGQQLHGLVLPGPPADAAGSGAWVVEHGPLLLYTTPEGLFALAGLGDTPGQVVAQARKTLAGTSLTSFQRRELRGTLASLEPETLLAFLAPGDFRTEGLLGEGVFAEPLKLQDREHYVPLTEDAAWRGPDDLSAQVLAAWNSTGLFLVVDVRDERFVPPAAGADLRTGDSLRLALNAGSSPRGLARGDELVLAVAWVDGETVTRIESDAPASAARGLAAHVTRHTDGKGLRYDLFIPWALLQAERRVQEGTLRELLAGLVIFDRDVPGMRGALEWGAGLTGEEVVPEWLARLTLVDASHEKIERYRQVIARLPDRPEAARYLDLVLLTRGGPSANEERAAELESFIRDHPASVHMPRVLRLLRETYQQLSFPAPVDRLLALARSARCPQRVLDSLSGNAFKFWVYPDPKSPPYLLGLQFQTRDGTRRGGYWGLQQAEWARDKSAVWLGDVPKAGEWTDLEVRPGELQIEADEILGLSFTGLGGLAVGDQATAVSGGQENVLLGDALPAQWSVAGTRLAFTDQPRRSGARAWLPDTPKNGNWSFDFRRTDGAPLFSFKLAPWPAPAAVDAAKQIQLYREAAELLADSPDGFDFLRHVWGLYTGPDRVVRCIQEGERYLRRQPDTVNALAILQALQPLYAQEALAPPLARTEETLQACRLPREVRRAFYNQVSRGWTEWHALGPFQASGERCGMDLALEPERNLDLGWKTKGPFESDLTWTALSAEKDERGAPNADGTVNLDRFLLARFDDKVRGQIEQAPRFAYAYRKFHVPARRRAALFLRGRGLALVWLNGRRVTPEPLVLNEQARPALEVQLNEGENEVLLKVGTVERRLAFRFRVADENGRAFDDLPQK